MSGQFDASCPEQERREEIGDRRWETAAPARTPIANRPQPMQRFALWVHSVASGFARSRRGERRRVEEETNRVHRDRECSPRGSQSRCSASPEARKKRGEESRRRRTGCVAIESARREEFEAGAALRPPGPLRPFSPSRPSDRPPSAASTTRVTCPRVRANPITTRRSRPLRPPPCRPPRSRVGPPSRRRVRGWCG
jgi:hypothetical protein